MTIEYDDVRKPKHYCEGRKYEPIQVIEDWKLGFHLGNALKYIARAGRKENEIEDLEKAIYYIQRYIANNIDLGFTVVHRVGSEDLVPPKMFGDAKCGGNEK